MFLIFFIFSLTLNANKNINTLSFALYQEPISLDPLLTYDEYTFNVTSNLYEPLIKATSSGKILPALAESWQIKDNKIIFKLRNAYWSDGSLIKIEDIYASFKRILTASNDSKSAHLLYVIKGAERFHKNIEKSFKKVGIKILSNKEIEFEFLYKNENMIETLAAPLAFVSFAPVKKELIEEAYFGQSVFAFSGPFKLKSWSHGDEILLERNEYYYENKILENRIQEIKCIIVRDEFASINLFKNGFLDFVPNLSMDSMENARKLNLNIKTFDKIALFFLNFNCEKVDKSLRKLISMTIQRDSICNKILKDGSEPAYSLVPKEFPGYESEKLFFESISKNEINKKLKLICGTDYLSQKIAQYLQEFLYFKLSIIVEIVSLNSILKVESLQKGDFDVSLNSWIADYFGPPFTFFEILKKDSSSNLSFWFHEKYEELYNKALESYYMNDKYKNLKEIEKFIFSGEFPIAPLFFMKGHYILNENIKGVTRGVSSRNPDFTYSFKTTK